MKKTMKRQLKSGMLCAMIENKYVKIASCKPMIEVTEDLQTLTLANGTPYNVRSCRAALVICNDVKYEVGKTVDVEFLKEIQRFALEFDEVESVRKEYTVTTRMFDNIIPTDIDLNGEWRFDITAHLETVKGLFPDLIFC